VVAYIPKVDPPFDEIEIEERSPRGKRGKLKPYLVVSLEALEAMLTCENAVLAEEDAPRLVACLCAYAKKADIGDTSLAERMRKYYDDRVEDDECA
jgi:hypothetical protein